VNGKNPAELIATHAHHQQRRNELASDVVRWFLDGHVGELYPRADVVAELSDALDISGNEATTALSDVVGDIVDPVQQLSTAGKKHVGIIEYTVFSAAGAYGYIDFDDRKGKRKRVVCARCVEKHEYDEQISHATQGEGSSPPDASWQHLLNNVTSHYADTHTSSPEAIEPGASLVSGTTISGNTAFHNGNDGSGSGLTADGVSVFQSTSDVSGLTEGDLVFIRDSKTVFVEDGT
jgi:hypothetical protein